MFQKDMKFAYLADFYGELLDEHTRSVIMAYYDDDLSLSEIADGEGISRQGVRHIIKRGEEQLSLFEEKLGLIKKHDELAFLSKQLLTVASELRLSDSKERELLSDKLSAIAKEISEK